MDYPKGIFPDVVENYVREYSDNQGFCEDILYSSYLSLISSMIGNRLSVRINQGWTESAMIWMAIVGYSGVKKTPATNAILKPLRKLNNKLFRAYSEEMEQYYRDVKIEKDIEKPFPEQLIIDDATMEAIIGVMAKNPHGLICYRDEIIGLINDGQRYNKNSQEQRLLSIYSGEPITINRKSDDFYSQIQYPYLSLLGGIQPAIIDALFKDQRSDNGFVNRFLFTYSPKHRPRAYNESFCGSELYDEYENFIHRFNEIEFNFEQEDYRGESIPVSSEAKVLHKTWFEKNLYNLELTDPNYGYLSKLEATAFRLSLIIEASWSISDDKNPLPPIYISELSMEKSLLLIEYYLSCYQEVRSLSKERNQIDSIRADFIKQVIKGVSEKREIVRFLLNKQYRNVDIHKATGISKATINYFGKD